MKKLWCSSCFPETIPGSLQSNPILLVKSIPTIFRKPCFFSAGLVHLVFQYSSEIYVCRFPSWKKIQVSLRFFLFGSTFGVPCMTFWAALCTYCWPRPGGQSSHREVPYAGLGRVFELVCCNCVPLRHWVYRCSSCTLLVTWWPYFVCVFLLCSYVHV